MSQPTKKKSGHSSPPKGYPKEAGMYADPANFKYPVDTAEHVRAAWSYIHVASNRSEYSDSELSFMEGRIKTAAKKFKVTLATGSAKESIMLTLESLLTEVKESSFGELDQGDLRCKIRDALKLKIQAEQKMTPDEIAAMDCNCGCCSSGCYAYVMEVFQTFIVSSESDDSMGYKSSYYKRPYSIAKDGTITVGNRAGEVMLSWVASMQEAMISENPQVAESVIAAVERGEPTAEALSAPGRTTRAVETTLSFESAVFGTEGVIKGVIPLKPGTSVNKKHYAREVVKRDHAVFNGLPVFYDHQDRKLGKPLKNLIGVTENAQWDEASGVPRVDLRYPQSEKATIESIREKHKMLGDNGVGLSIDMEVRSTTKQIAGKIVQNVEALLGGQGASVDVVYAPSAGGGFDRALEAQIDEEIVMLEGLTLAQIKETRPDLWAQIEKDARESIQPPAATDPAKPNVDVSAATGLTREEISALVRESVQAAMPKTEATPPVAGLTIEQVRAEMELAAKRSAFEGRVREAKLPEKIQNQIVREAADANFDEAKASEIFEQWANIAAAAGSGVKITVPGSGGVRVTESQDVRYARLLGAALQADQEVGGQKVQRYTSWRDAICAWHPNLIQSYIDNPSEFARESMAHLAWGGGDCARVQREYSREAIVTTTFALAWADVLHKAMMQEVNDPTWNQWRQLVSNYERFTDLTNTHKLLQFGEYPDVPLVNEGAPYQPTTTPTERKVEFAIEKHGALESWTWEAALRDDMNRLAQIPRKLGKAWARTVYRFIFSLLTANSGTGATMDYDSTVLYHANHNNIGSDAFAVDKLIAADGKMKAQTDFSSGEAKEYIPKFLLYAFDPTMRLNIWAAMVSQYNLNVPGDTANSANYIRTVLGYEPIEVRYPGGATTTRWELVADPQNAPTIAVGFLNGNDAPELFVQDMDRVGSVFSADKYTLKIRGTVGADLLNHESFVRGNV